METYIKAYKKKFKFKNFAIEHEYFCKDSITGVYTNQVEGVKNGIKHLIKKSNKTTILMIIYITIAFII